MMTATPGDGVHNSNSSSSQGSAQSALAAAESRFIANNPLSKKQHGLAVDSLPGGNTRTLLYTSPFPLSINRGEGAYVWDEDGHKYVDFVGELSAGLYGHSRAEIRQAILSTLDATGLSLGATTAHEQRYASLLCARFRLARVRTTNSGTEANLHALAGARRFTGRRKVVVFSGGYHGAVLSFPDGRPAPNAVDPADFVVAPRYNHVPSALDAIAAAAADNDLAAVLVEPMQGSAGCIPATAEFLAAVQDAAHARGALFILDEVMTSRLAPHGLGVEMGLRPDLVTMGKYLGGGLAFGAFGGREDVMAVYDPRVEGALAHSGTFNNNTLVMRAGLAGLREVYTPEVCVRFREIGDNFRERLRGVARGTRMSFTGRGSLIGLHFTEDGTEDIRCKEDIKGKVRTDLRDLFWFEMLEAGFWTTRRGFIAMILDTPQSELDAFVGAVTQFLERHRDLMMVA
ncbi:Glutamate-1-semialdehyde-aminomutase protein [Madurella fahalii]|uniref:Glutamate-1-semialdehyde-aminomutase protein n=1 Tax=Madurella fahalii TaxID=1157608 RepID=A0ABQ0GHD1_9PEZI